MKGFTGCNQNFFKTADGQVNVEGGCEGLRRRVTAIRCDNNLYQYEVAQDAGMTPDALSHLLGGRGKITEEKLQALAGALGVSVERLIGNVPEAQEGKCACRKLPEWLIDNVKTVGELIIGQEKKFKKILPDGFVCPVCGSGLVKQGKRGWFVCPLSSCGFTAPGEDAEEHLRVMNLGLALAAAMCRGPAEDEEQDTPVRKDSSEEKKSSEEKGSTQRVKAAVRRVVTLVRATESMNLEGSTEVFRLVEELLKERSLDVALSGGVSLAEVVRLRERLESRENEGEGSS